MSPDSGLMQTLGVDIGGSGIKGAIVETTTGELVQKRIRIETPDPATATAVVAAVKDLVRQFKWKGPVGCGYPGVVKSNIVYTAANLHESLIGKDLARSLKAACKCKNVCILNDADAAGFAEIRLGAGRGVKGLVIMITVGTGIGTAIFNDGVLLPNTEIGHIIFKGKDAEKLLSEPARKARQISHGRWEKDFNKYLEYLEALFWPDMFILGGGGFKKPEKYAGAFETRAPVQFAKFKNQAGIIGAAIAASEGVVIK
jgi:polyphosphate glucokinase